MLLSIAKGGKPLRSFNSNILCVVVHGVYKPWTEITEVGQENTWLQLPQSKRIKIVHAYGIPVKSIGLKFDRFHERLRFAGRWTHLFLNVFDWIISVPFLYYIPKVKPAHLLKNHHEQLQVQFPDIYLTHRWKELALMNYFVNFTEFDYLYMTTSSSYIRTEKLIESIDTFSSLELYAGSIPNVTGRFASGANRVISRAAAKKIVSKRTRWSPRWLGDFGLGRLCESIGIDCQEMSTLNIDSVAGVDSLTDAEILQNHHFRLKSGRLDKRNDVEIMFEVHRRTLLAEK
jgi:hypothetical protein